MPVLSRCPLCRGVMADTRGGEARCPRCGELVLPAIRKLCAGCGSDVTRDKRVRDEQTSEYYCHDCWDNKQAARGEVYVGYVCHVCRMAFASDQVYQEEDVDAVICHDCYGQREMGGTAVVSTAAAVTAGRGGVTSRPSVRQSSQSAPPPPLDEFARYRRKADMPWGLISFGIAVLIAIVAMLVVVSVR